MVTDKSPVVGVYVAVEIVWFVDPDNPWPAIVNAR